MAAIKNKKQAVNASSNEVAVGGHGQAKEIIGRFMRNKAAVFGLVIVAFLLIAAMFPQLFTKYDPIAQDLRARFLPPSSEHLFGTDEYGRDIFSRVIYGCRTSMEIGLVTVAISCIVGVVIGAVAGFYSGVTDNVLMRFIDILMAIPNTLLGISIVAALGSTIPNLIIALSIGSIAGYARVTRVSVLSTKGTEYVEAAYSTGASDARIIFKYILPNCMSVIFISVALQIPSAIFTESFLSFIGLGVQAPDTSMGILLSDGQKSLMQYPYKVWCPAIVISLLMIAFNMLANGLRDAFDPTQRGV